MGTGTSRLPACPACPAPTQMECEARYTPTVTQCDLYHPCSACLPTEKRCPAVSGCPAGQSCALTSDVKCPADSQCATATEVLCPAGDVCATSTQVLCPAGNTCLTSPDLLAKCACNDTLDGAVCTSQQQPFITWVQGVKDNLQYCDKSQQPSMLGDGTMYNVQDAPAMAAFYKTCTGIYAPCGTVT